MPAKDVTPETPESMVAARTLGSVQGEDAVIAMAGSSQKPELLKTPTQEMDSAVTEPSEATVFEEFSAAEPASKLPSSADPLTHMTVRISQETLNPVRKYNLLSVGDLPFHQCIIPGNDNGWSLFVLILPDEG